MKISRIAILTTILLFTVTLAPVAPRVHGDIDNGSIKWLNTAFLGSDSFFNGPTVAAYVTGATATLTIPVTNPVANYIDITAGLLKMDWNGNYTASGLPLRIQQNSQGVVTITFTVPPISTASNLRTHLATSLYLNYTSPAFTGTRQFFGSVPGNPVFAVYNADQASAQTAILQLSSVNCSGGFGATRTFITAQGNSLCLQAAQQANIGRNLYTQGDFTGANTALKAAVNDWNQALQAESSTGAGVDLGTTVAGYGGLLLGIGAVIGGIAVFIYLWRRPKELRAAAASTTH